MTTSGENESHVSLPIPTPVRMARALLSGPPCLDEWPSPRFSLHPSDRPP